MGYSPTYAWLGDGMNSNTYVAGLLASAYSQDTINTDLLALQENSGLNLVGSDPSTVSQILPYMSEDLSAPPSPGMPTPTPDEVAALVSDPSVASASPFLDPNVSIMADGTGGTITSQQDSLDVMVFDTGGTPVIGWGPGGGALA